MLSGVCNDRLNLPGDLSTCHEVIRSLRQLNQDLRHKLAIYEENERLVFRHIYGSSTTPASLLDLARLMAGKEPLIRSGHPDDPTVGEVFTRERAQRRRQQAERRRQARQRRNSDSASA